MSEKMSYLLRIWIVLLLCFGVKRMRADEVDSLLNALKVATHDTDRIKILSVLAETCETNDILKYAEQSKSLCEKGIAAKLNPLHFYLSNLASSINNIGYYYSKHGDQTKALIKYKAALKILQQIGDKKSAAYELNNIATIYDNQGDIPIALEYFYKNLKLQEEIKDTIGIAYTLNNIAYVFFNQRDSKNAMDYFSKSLKMFESVNYKKGIAMVYGNIGLIYTRQNNKNKALDFYNKSLAIYKELDDQYNVTYELSSIGHEYYKAGEDDKALEYFTKSLKTAEAFQIKAQLAYTLNEMARIFFKRGIINTAQEYSIRSLQLAKEVGNPKDIQNASGLLKEIYNKKGNYKEAFEMYQTEIQMRDSIENKANRKEMITKSLQYQYEKKELQMKLESERKIVRKNILIFISLFIAFAIIMISFFYTRQNNFRIQLERMELEQQQYRSQMNPHFIFNCLNSIQHYIVHNDVIAANKYLSEFASLMRKTLENNKLHAISLQQEIDYLNSYLMLEQMRFENKFTYEITCDKNINTVDTQILPMVIQPFAENAIVHGLCYLEKDGKLSVSFEKQNDYLVCKIDDNGIGRTASQSIKKESNRKHISQGMELIEKRLALVSNITKKKFDVEIIDKTNAAGKASGTLVILKFPAETI